MKPRALFRVLPQMHGRGWKLVGPERVATYRLKARAVAEGRRQGRARWRKGRLAQLVVHKADGRFQTEYTYGKDPARYRG